MTETITLDWGPGAKYTVEVEELGPAARARFLAMYPENATGADEELIDWFVEVAEWATPFSEDDLMSMPAVVMMDICKKSVMVALDVEEPRGRSPTRIPTDGWMVVSR